MREEEEEAGGEGRGEGFDFSLKIGADNKAGGTPGFLAVR